MINKIGICDKCKGFDYKEIIKKLDSLNYKFEYNIGCQNFCGIGRTRCFLILNNIPIVADNQNELIEKVINELKKRSN
jgi:hypothetical protein